MLLKNEQNNKGQRVRQPNPVILFGFLTTILVVMGGLALMKGALLIGKHEADTLHLLQIVFRMDAGQWPHLDFMTPIGALAFVPISFFMGQGAGVGHAILYAQIGLGLVLLPAIWWAGISRMQGLVPYLFGAVVLVLATALVFGLDEPTISISMYYNRWAWAISFVALALAILPVIGADRVALDAGIIGICMAALVLLKMTYFVAFAPVVIIAMLLRKSYKTLAFSLLVGLAVIAVVTLFVGVEFWQAYLGDLLQVASSEVRPQPGEDLWVTVLSPAYLSGTLAAVAGVVLLRQTNNAAAGTSVLLVVLAFVYVTFQNFGNDPKWLAMLAVLVFALRPDAAAVNGQGLNLRASLTVVGVVALTLSAPMLFNLASSPYRHLNLQTAWHQPILPQELHGDIRVLTVRANRVQVRRAVDAVQLEPLIEGAMYNKRAVLFGEPLENCKLELGLTGWIGAISQDLQQAGLTTGKRMFVADAFSSHWMFSDLEPLPQGAPWYYSGLPGFAAADYLLVPLCPAEPDVRRQVLAEIHALDAVVLTEVRRNDLYILLEIAH